MHRVSEVAAYYFDSVVKENTVIGISWGSTLYHLVQNINENNKKNIPITVVPIMGASNSSRPDRDSMDLAKTLSAAYGGKCQYIYAPLFVKTVILRESLIQDNMIKDALALAKNADIMLSSIGSIENRTWINYLGDRTFTALEEKGAVGHIGGHFFDIDGNEVITPLSSRMIGVSFDDLRKCKNLICVAAGVEKSKALKGALASGIIDTLIIDNTCAQGIVES